MYIFREIRLLALMMISYRLTSDVNLQCRIISLQKFSAGHRPPQKWGLRTMHHAGIVWVAGQGSVQGVYHMKGRWACFLSLFVRTPYFLGDIPHRRFYTAFLYVFTSYRRMSKLSRYSSPNFQGPLNNVTKRSCCK